VFRALKTVRWEFCHYRKNQILLKGKPKERKGRRLPLGRKGPAEKRKDEDTNISLEGPLRRPQKRFTSAKMEEDIVRKHSAKPA